MAVQPWMLSRKVYSLRSDSGTTFFYAFLSREERAALDVSALQDWLTLLAQLAMEGEGEDKEQEQLPALTQEQPPAPMCKAQI
eukprot:CAMPEP_0180784164 /NCGR_PEP_ID=MMETSP1038_2-20121128/49447_1 /TAXON_ID=632150 /ORGANISM="Azadinium spinosum, Strain 3D9" /LENGTH=82 /DNA_ID=CAMNT_0022820853 /DNA_START=91 /DNA_END=339 /DNA_ORIENTATION=-